MENVFEQPICLWLLTVAMVEQQAKKYIKVQPFRYDAFLRQLQLNVFFLQDL